MSMAAPTYMRSLTGTFSAAPHHSPAAASAWAAASASARPTSSLSHHHHQHLSSASYTPSISTHNTHIYTHHLQNFNSHHDRSYHHHLQPSSPNSSASSCMGLHSHHALRKAVGNVASQAGGLGSPNSNPLPGASGAHGRRRSSSIRSKNPPPFIKFDPFADEPLLPAAAPTTGAAQSADAAISSTGLALGGTVPTEIQRHTSPSASSRRIIASQQSPAHSFNNSSFGPVNGGNGSSTLRYAGPIGSYSPSPSNTGSVSAPVSRAPSPSPSPPATPLRSSTPTPRSSTVNGAPALGGPNISKLVAGIMLNRVAVGKPMRRRVVPATATHSRQYRKSSLSSVVSCEA